jgi:hypothetical protein
MPVVILSLAGPICYRRASQSFPRDLSGFFARLLEVSVISPQVRSVFAAVYEDAAGPCRSDAYAYMSEGVARMLGDANLGGPSSPGTAAGLSAARRSSLRCLAVFSGDRESRTLELLNIAFWCRHHLRVVR